MEPIKRKTAGYSLYIISFIALALITLLAVGLTQVRFDTSVLMALVLLLAVVQAAIILFYNMHLKFHDKILLIFVLIVFTLIFLVIITTLVDYIYR
jgi:heme/copper-type cytochrome/quinol oxidase subunit 4